MVSPLPPPHPPSPFTPHPLTALTSSHTPSYSHTLTSHTVTSLHPPPLFRYFGSAEGSKCVELASCENVKRSWVNYGESRDWTSMEQGQVGWNRNQTYYQLRPLPPSLHRERSSSTTPRRSRTYGCQWERCLPIDQL